MSIAGEDLCALHALSRCLTLSLHHTQSRFNDNEYIALHALVKLITLPNSPATSVNFLAILSSLESVPPSSENDGIRITSPSDGCPFP